MPELEEPSRQAVNPRYLDAYERETMSIEKILAIQELINPYDNLPEWAAPGFEDNAK